MTPKIEDIVYLKTGEDREAKLVTAICRRKHSVQFELTSGCESSWHYDFEFSKEKSSKIKEIKGLR